jgi:catechol 2,3-dioxygenase-like lactoylglutathione lyase family enzyme
MTGFAPHRDVQAISHLNVVVDDIEAATEFYRTVDIRFLKHPEVGIYLELFTYHHPKGDQEIRRRQTNDLGGIRHVALEVPDAVAAHTFIRAQQQAYGERGRHIEILGHDHVPEELTPFPYKFFYWIDPWGVQWEMEEGRPIDRVLKGITG